MAAPGMDDSNTRRREFPSVTPYPRSRGSTTNLPYLGPVSSVWMLGSVGSIVTHSPSCLPQRYSARDAISTLQTHTYPNRSARIEFDDELLFHIGIDIIPGRQRDDAPLHRLRIELQPLGQTVFGAQDAIARLFDVAVFRHALMHTHDIAGLEDIRGDVDPMAVDGKMSVRHHLPRHGAGGRKTEPIDHIIQAGLQQLQQVLAGNAGAAQGLVHIVTELIFQDPVDTAQLLLFTQLHAIFRQFLGERRGAVHPRGLIAPARFAIPAHLFEGTTSVAFVAFEEELDTLPAALPTPRIMIRSHTEFVAPCGFEYHEVTGRGHIKQPDAFRGVYTRIGSALPPPLLMSNG